MLEMASMLCYIQVATLTHWTFLLIPLGALLMMAMLRHQGPHLLLREPLYLLFPHEHSRFGLKRQQTSATRFIAFAFVLKLSCSVVFWASLSEASVNDEIWPPAHRDLTCDAYMQETKATHHVCGFRRFGFGSREQELQLPKILQLWEGEGGTCQGPCRGCEPEVHREGWVSLRMHCEPASKCQLMCCQCLHCQLSPSVPLWLQPGCIDGAFVPEAPKHLFCYDAQICPGGHTNYYRNSASYTMTAWHSQNIILTQLATHVLTHKADPQDVQFWWTALCALELLPCLALGAWLLLSLALPRLLQQEPLSMLGQSVSDVGAIERVDAEAKRLRVEISRKRLRPTLKDKISLHMQFAFFLVDYASDCNCLAQMLLEQRYSVAIAQALMIVLPVALPQGQNPVG